MKVKILLLDAVILFYSVAGFAQDELNVIPPTPESSQIHRFDLYPVDLFTGTTDISVPIYSINVDGLAIPIILKYQASGVKLEDESGSVGLGWSLIAGGRISRAVRGSADEWGLFEARNENDIKQLHHDATPDSILEDYYNYFYLLEQGSRDSEQDLFYYSTPTVNGRFILNETSHHVFICTTVPFRPIQWDYGIENNTPKFTYFEITDENGTYFRFGKSIINPSDMNWEVTSAPAVPTTWLLSEIITADKSDTIQFTYKARNTMLPAWYGRWIPNDYVKAIDYGYEDGAVTSSPYLNFQNGYDVEQIQSHSRIDYQRAMIDAIQFKNGKIEFVSDASSVMIKSIRIYNKVNGVYILIRETILNYNTFENKEHYTLNEVIFNDKSSEKVYSYSFDYNNENEPFLSISQTKGIDWWGYYNGFDSNDYLYPSMDLYLMTHNGFPAQYNLSGGNRNANDNAKHSILTDIILPTGARTHFGYEGNFYDNGWMFTRGGGLRIESITNYSADNELLYMKKYRYGASESGYGISLVEPRPEYYKSETTQFYLSKGPYDSDDYSYRQTYVGSSPTVDLSYSQQPSVVYPYVTEYLENAQMEQLGKTEYIFSFNDEALVQEDFIWPLSHNPFVHSYYKGEIRDWGQEGNLLDKTIYRKDDGIYKPVQKIQFFYDTFSISEYHNLVVRPYGSWETELERLAFNKYYINTSSTGRFYQSYRDFCKFAWAFGDQKIITGATRLSSKISYEYDSDGNTTLENKVKYRYSNPDHLFVSETVTYKSDGDSIITVNFYPHDYPANIETPIAVIDTMISRNIISPILKQESKLNGTTFVSGVINNFKLDQNLVVPSDLEIAGRDGVYEARKQFHDYDGNGNLLNSSNDSGLVTSYLWGYGQSLPVAKVVGANIDQVAFCSFEEVDKYNNPVDTGTGWTFYGCLLDSEGFLGDKHIMGQTPGAKLSKTIPQGKYVLTFWSKTQVPMVKLDNTTLEAAIVKTVGDWELCKVEIISSGNLTLEVLIENSRIDEARLFPASAQMTSYTYSPMVGMTSVTDPSGVTVRHEYDDFGRLNAVRDTEGNILKHYYYHYKE